MSTIGDTSSIKVLILFPKTLDLNIMAFGGKIVDNASKSLPFWALR